MAAPVGLVPLARAVARGTVDPSKLSPSQRRRVAAVREAIGDDVLKHDPKPRPAVHTYGEAVRSVRTV